MKCIFLYNPHGGKGKIVKKLRRKYETVDVYASRAPADFTHRVREFAADYDCIVFAGGDGTFNEILQGIGDMENPPLLGYIPSGTVNDVAHSLGIPRYSLRRALNVVLEGREERLDCMLVNGTRYAMYSVSAGAFTSARRRKTSGAWAHWLTGWRECGRIYYSAFFRFMPQAPTRSWRPNACLRWS